MNPTPNPTPAQNLSSSDQPNKAREELRSDIVSTLNALEPGETRVSYPDGHSEIASNFSLATDDIMHLVDTYLQNAVEEIIGKDADGYMLGGDAYGIHEAQNELRAEQREKAKRYLNE